MRHASSNPSDAAPAGASAAESVERAGFRPVALPALAAAVRAAQDRGKAPTRKAEALSDNPRFQHEDAPQV